MCLLVQMCTQFCQYKSRHSVIWSVIWWSYLVKLRLYTNLHATHCTNSQYQSFKFLLPGISNDFIFISAMSLCMDSSYLLKFWSLSFLLKPSRYSHFTVNFHNSNIWRPNECFWYLLFLLSHSVVFLYLFALIPEEGFLIFPCYSLELLFGIQIGKVKWSEVVQSCPCPTLCDPVDCSLPSFSVHGILQARILEWITISFSRGSSRPRDLNQVSRTGGRCFNLWAIRYIFHFLLCLSHIFFSQLFVRPPQTTIWLFCISFSWGWSWSRLLYNVMNLHP